MFEVLDNAPGTPGQKRYLRLGFFLEIFTFGFSSQ